MYKLNSNKSSGLTNEEMAHSAIKQCNRMILFTTEFVNLGSTHAVLGVIVWEEKKKYWEKVLNSGLTDTANIQLS